MQKTITSLRSDKAALTQKLRSVESAPAAPIRSSESEAKHRDERLAWRKEKAELESQLRKATRSAASVEDIRKEKERLEAENGSLEETIAKMAYLYRMQYRSSVPASALAEAKEELALVEAELRASKTSSAVLRQRIKHAESDLEEKDELLQDARAQQQEATRINEEIMKERLADRQTIGTVGSASVDLFQPLEPHDYRPFVDAIMAHIDLASSSSSTLITTLLETASDLRSEADSLRNSTLDAQTSLVSAQTRARELESKLIEAEAAHSPCAQQILDWRGEASRASAMESRLRSELSDAKRCLADVESMAKEAKDRLKRANEQNGRGGAAMQAMEDELAE
jgi:chromosome segregation ATPase